LFFKFYLIAINISGSINIAFLRNRLIGVYPLSISGFIPIVLHSCLLYWKWYRYYLLKR